MKAKTTQNIVNEWEEINLLFQEGEITNEQYDKFDEKKWIELKDVLELPEKSLESAKLDLCGYSQDDVWEEAIKWVKSKLTKANTKGTKR